MTISVQMLRGAALALAAMGGVAHGQQLDQGPSQPPAETRSVPTAAQSTLTPLDLEVRRILSVGDVAGAVPEVTSAPTLNSSNTLILFLRGQGQDNPSQITRGGAIGIYRDGLPVARSQALTFDLGDLERVEVLRGPQGAEYGADTSGGVINLVSRQPAGELRFKQDVDFGNRNSFRILSSLDTPRWHALSAKLTVLASSVDGYVKNLDTASQDFGEERQRAGRAQIRWEPLGSLRADYSYEKGNLDSTAAYDSNPSLNGSRVYFFFPYYARPDGPMTRSYRAIPLPLSTSSRTDHGLTLTWQPTPALTVRSLTGYRDLDSNPQHNYAEIFNLAEGSVDLYRQRQFSQDLSAGGNLWDSQLGYAAGVSYYKEHGRHDRTQSFLTVGYLYQNRILADWTSKTAYARLDWRPSLSGRPLQISVAARYTRDDKHAERFLSDSNGPIESGAASGAISRLKYNRVNPAVTVSYRWTDKLNSYVKYSTGYKSGGALETADAGQFGTSAFIPEKLVTYEAGLKAGWLDGRMQADITVFHSRYEDIQYAIPVTILADEAYPLRKATIQGAELDLQAKLTQDLTIRADAGYLHWRIDRVDVLPGTVFDPATQTGSPYTVGQNISNLFELQYAPKYSFTLGGEYTFLHLDRRDVGAHLDFAYRGQVFSDPITGPGIPGRQFDSIPAVGLLNARITMSQETDWSHHVRFSLWGHNVLNRKYYRFAAGVGSGVTQFTTSGSGVTVPAGYTARAGAWAEPATYGVDIRYEY